jgi:hypothetical protein
MPKIVLKLSDGLPTLVTYGSLWSVPREAGDGPVKPNLTIGYGEDKELTLKSGRYVYYFAFTGQQEDEEFSMSASYVEPGSPPPTEQTFKTDKPGGRVFRFMV